MTTTTPTINPGASTHARAKGFTLFELIVATSISTLIFAGILTAFLMIGRTGYNAAGYSIMESEARRALESFSIEARMANNVVSTGTTAVDLTVVTSGSTYTVGYGYDSATKTFYRVLGPASTVAGRVILVRDVQDFAFRRFKVVNGIEFDTTSDPETKQIQITLRTVRSRTTAVDATNAVLSARVVLRNKNVST